MSTKHNLHVAHQIPSHIPPTYVIAALHDHSTALTLQALTCGHTKAHSTPAATLKDTYWYPPDQYPITTYHVTECITWCPGIGEYGKKYITFPSCFQDTRMGIKTRADAAAGVTVRAEFRVLRNGEGGSEVEGEGGGVGDAKWILVEDVEVTCLWWLMPFVKGKLEEAHRDVCKKVIGSVEEEIGLGWKGVVPVVFAEQSGRERHDSQDGEREKAGTGFAQAEYGMPQPVVFGQTHHEVDGAEMGNRGAPVESVPSKILYQ